MDLSNELSCEAGSIFHFLDPHRSFQSEALRLHFPAVEPWLHGLTPWLFLPVYLHANVGPLSLPAASSPDPLATTLPHVLSSLAALLRPSYWSG